MPTPTRRSSWVAFAALVIIATALRSASAQGASQVWQPEISAAAGLGHVFRYRDQGYGDEPNVSGAVLLRHRSGFGVEIEANHTIGLKAGPAPCAVYSNRQPVTCTGSARDGALAASSVSFNLHYLFTGRRVQPYLLGGVGILRTRMVTSITTVSGNTAVQTEIEDTATGLGPDVGAGLRIPIGARLTVAPEVRWLEAASLSRHNLAATRVSARLSWVF